MGKVSRFCSVAECDAPHAARGWCRKHYVRWKRLGTVSDEVMTWGRPSSPCAYCGSPQGRWARSTRTCGSACLAALSRDRPRTNICGKCGDEFSLMLMSIRTKRFVKSERTLCHRCNRKPNHLRTFIPPLVARDGANCGICRSVVDLTLKYPHPDSPSVDHVIPRSLGGADALWNFQLACLHCNLAKRAQVNYTP